MEQTTTATRNGIKGIKQAMEKATTTTAAEKITTKRQKNFKNKIKNKKKLYIT